LFVSHILAWLEMADFLRQHPHWLAYQLPFRFFHRLGRDLGAADEDPMLALLATPPAEIESTDFVIPAKWRQGIMRDGACQLRRVSGRPGVRLLFDSSGEVPLALWSGQMPLAAADLLAGQTPRRRPPLPELDPAELLLSAWLTAVSRWCHRFTSLALPDLVNRPGQVAATRTHIDVFFDLQQMDIDVRRAGLDFDPGWVAWLGRVIYFHYLAGEADLFP
jgi:hypothetical protein